MLSSLPWMSTGGSMYDFGGSFSQAKLLCHPTNAFKLETSLAAGSGLFGTDWRHAWASEAGTVGKAAPQPSQSFYSKLNYFIAFLN